MAAAYRNKVDTLLLFFFFIKAGGVVEMWVVLRSSRKLVHVSGTLETEEGMNF